MCTFILDLGNSSLTKNLTRGAVIIAFSELSVTSADVVFLLAEYTLSTDEECGMQVKSSGKCL